MELEIKNVSKTYGNDVEALQGISLTVNKGMFGLLGQNGAGKSTLRRSIATLQDANNGSIFLMTFAFLKPQMNCVKYLDIYPKNLAFILM